MEFSKTSPTKTNVLSEQEEQRSAMRMALARRMKQSLVESEEARSVIGIVRISCRDDIAIPIHNELNYFLLFI
jgi:hypothetical protein